MIAYEMKNILHFIATRCDSGDGRNSNFPFRSLNPPKLDLSEFLPAPPPSRQVLSSSVSFETIVRMQ